MISIPILTSETEFKSRLHHRKPIILRGSCLGACTSTWKNSNYVIEKSTNKNVTVHLSSTNKLSFMSKNFEYTTMDFHSLIRLCSTHSAVNDKFCYLRSIGTTERRPSKPVNFETDFPELSSDFNFPLHLFDSSQFHSSVLRVSSPGVRVWTHYDIPDNVYVQIVGRKSVILWEPKFVSYSQKGDLADNPDLIPFQMSENLIPGDILYIPALWFHSMTACDFGMAVNIFWKNLSESFYDTKDVYGNKDLIPAFKANQMLENVLKQLDKLPEYYKDFYGRKLMDRIQEKCLMK